jgi:hypothetical protein
MGASGRTTVPVANELYAGWRTQICRSEMQKFSAARGFKLKKSRNEPQMNTDKTDKRMKVKCLMLYLRKSVFICG